MKKFLLFATPIIVLAAGLTILGLARTPVARITEAERADDAAQANGQSTPPAGIRHSVSVRFDYDFGVTPACTGQNVTHCVQQFVVYDISAGTDKSKRSTLFTIPVPRGAKGLVHGITGSSPKMDFESGKHLIAVVAQEPGDIESNPAVCSTWVTVP